MMPFLYLPKIYIRWNKLRPVQLQCIQFVPDSSTSCVFLYLFLELGNTLEAQRSSQQHRGKLSRLCHHCHVKEALSVSPSITKSRKIPKIREITKLCETTLLFELVCYFLISWYVIRNRMDKSSCTNPIYESFVNDINWSTKPLIVQFNPVANELWSIKMWFG